MGRRSRACQACRARKARCLPGTKAASCRRCETLGARCVSYEAVEVVSWLKGAEDRYNPSDHEIARATPSRSDKTPSNAEILNRFGPGWLRELAIKDVHRWPACYDLTLDKATVFLGQYARMAQTIPFATRLGILFSLGRSDVPPSAVEVVELESSSPIFLLAAILTGSSSDPQFEKQADDLFRQILADRVIVKGQESLELLQSLLTYMTWYHHRFDPETLQFYQFLQLANGMVVDLGLPKKFANVGESESLTIDDVHEHRAFLLCYYLNCGGAVLGYDRPENMRCIESLRNAADVLSDVSRRPQDKEARAVVELLYAVAYHHSKLNSIEQGITVPTSNPPSLGHWGTTYMHDKLSPSVKSTFQFAAAYTRLKSSKARIPSAVDVELYLHHFHELLSNILSQDLDYLVRLGIVEWAHLITTLFLLARLGRLESVANISGDSTRNSPAIESITRFQIRLHDLREGAVTKPTLSAPHLFSWLDRILAAVMQRTKPREPLQMPAAIEIGHQESAYELVNSFLDDDSAESGRSRPATADLRGEDFWGEFMSDWLDW